MKTSQPIALALLLSSSFLVAVPGSADPSCVEKKVRVGASKMASLLPSCLLALPGADDSTRSRSYVINPSGQFMVFNTFNNRGNTADTGSRVYYFFPIRQKPALEKNPISGEVIAHTAGGQAIQLDSQWRVVGMTGAKFTEDPVISSHNKGGFEISYLDGILLDGGWAVGRQAIENRKGTSTFRDRQGTSCPVSNSEIFSYTKYDLNLAFKTNEEIARFLKKRCPRLDLSPFSANAPIGDSGPAAAPSSGSSARE